MTGQHLVTGSSGFIGTHLVRALVEAGENVIGVDRAPAAMKAPRYRHLQREISELRSEDVDGATHIYHLAGHTGTGESWGVAFHDYVRDNINTTQTLLELARAAPSLKKFVLAGSSSVYGNADVDVVRESMTAVPYSPYAVTKKSSEDICTAYRQNFGIPTVTLRLFYAVGPGQRPNVIVHRLIAAALNGQEISMYGDALNVGRDFIHIEDIVDAIRCAARSPESADGGTFNIATGRFTTLAELVTLIEVAVGQPIKLRAEPARPGFVKGARGDAGRAAEMLGWSPARTLEEALTAQSEWQRHTIDG